MKRRKRRESEIEKLNTNQSINNNNKKKFKQIN